MKKRRFGLRAKFTVLFLLFAVAIMVSVGIMTYNSYRDAMMKKYADEAIKIAKLAASYLDGDEILRYSQTGEKDAEWERLKEILDNIKEQTGVIYLYVIVPVSENSTVYIFEAALKNESDNAELGDQGPWDDNFKSAKEAMATGEPSEELEPTWTEWGYLASAYVPIKDSSGNAVGVVGVDFTMDEIQTFLINSSKNLLILMAIVVGVCFLFLILMLNIGIISPIRMIKSKVLEMSEGQLGVQVSVQNRDELGDIAQVFNRMSHNIGVHISEVTELNEGYYKFVPSVIFGLLGKKSISEIRLGDYRRVPLEVLSMQVDAFEEKIRKMSSQEMFAFANRIYQLSVPLLTEKNGVVESYFNGGLNAIYLEGKKDALDSAISICQKLNSEKKTGADGSLKNVDLTFGISRDDVLMGIVGHEERLAAVAMSEQMSIIGYLRSIGWKYKARILITGKTAESISDFEERYHSRLLGLLHISASDTMETIYDVYDGDEELQRELKEATREAFETGVRLFLDQRFHEARRAFVEVLKVFGNDYAAREYLYLCNQYYTKEETSDIDVYIEDF